FNIHDPCTARYEPDIHSSVRSLIKKAGFNVDEIDHSKEESHCCGMGGMVYVVDEELGKLRSRRVLNETDLNTVTYCATCRETLQGQGGNILHILDLIFNPDWKNTLNKPPNSPETTIENMKLLKKELFDKYSGT
ncbi:MAG: (Fe-S)-binding protein, partial [Ignavibacteria bacterium]|nr:(Fe-S)-binding protein [Ignavibacteria bacterium]